MNRLKLDTSSWVQPPLIPVLWPLVVAKVCLKIPGDGTKSMFSYSVFGEGDNETLVAGGIDWIGNVHQDDERAEVWHDLVEIALEHLSPF